MTAVLAGTLGHLATETVLTGPSGEPLAELSEFLGIRTNNYAEYSGLLGVLNYALEHNHRRLRVVSDSELMVKQIQGKYRVAHRTLNLWQEVKNRIAKLDTFEISHALRHKNKYADRLANQAMDRGMSTHAPGEPHRLRLSHPLPRKSSAPPNPDAQPSQLPCFAALPATASFTSSAALLSPMGSSSRSSRSEPRTELLDRVHLAQH